MAGFWYQLLDLTYLSVNSVFECTVVAITANMHITVTSDKYQTEEPTSK